MDTAEDLIKKYLSTRNHTEFLCKDLLVEDYVIQSMEDVSPPKWHLAHTTWFFEHFILNKYTNYQHSYFNYIFNSYYQGAGTPYPRFKRGLLARPSVQQIYEYRSDVDYQMIRLMKYSSLQLFKELKDLIILGINHEEQHQELLLMDIKYNFYSDPSLPVYSKKVLKNEETQKQKTKFFEIDGGLIEIGYEGEGFCFDNELPRHQKFIQPFFISSKLISNQEYLAFIEDGGYSNPKLWLADGYNWLQAQQIKAPLYWHLQDKEWMTFGFHGLEPLDLNKPVAHVSYYEADAFAKWQECRLPTEEEWEHAVYQLKIQNKKDYFRESKFQSLEPSDSADLFGNLWEWTSSSYLPYPGYKPLQGTIGEYNAKFMSNQMVLRGGSFATPAQHIRASYRNYYASDKRWQFSGIRLVKN